MKSTFLLTVLGLTGLLVLVHLAILKVLVIGWHPIYLSAYCFFPLITMGIHLLIEKKLKSRPQAFVTYFMGSMTAKLLSALALLLIVLYTNPNLKVHFAILFMTFYMAYTALSVIVLFKKLREEN